MSTDYIFNWYSYLSTKSNINRIAKRYNLEVGSFHQGNHEITSVLKVTDYTYNNYCYLAEFPGNCSAVVLHHIEDANKSRENMLKFACDICEEFGYALLFVTGTSPGLKLLLKNNGFRFMINNMVNPHSDLRNFFGVKHFPYYKYDEDDFEVEEEDDWD